jgi:hypothetical protein
MLRSDRADLPLGIVPAFNRGMNRKPDPHPVVLVLFVLAVLGAWTLGACVTL